MDKSRPASSRNTSKARTPTCAKFLVQKAAFFGTAKKILTVTQDSILIDNLNNDAKQREEIPFQELTSIKRSPVYDAEFTLVSRKSEAPPIFCASRSRCLADIYIAWDKFIEQESPQLGSNNFLKFEVSKVVIPDNHDFFIEVDLFIYRSHMELVNKSLHDPSKLEKQYIEIKNPEFVVGSVTVIPFYSIGTIYKTHKGIVIEMKDSGAQHRLLFYDLEKTNKVINSIQNNYREYVGAQVDVSTEEFDEGLVPDYVSPKVYKLFFFNTKVYKIIESGHFLPIEIALSDDYLIEIDMNTGLVIQKLELSGVKHVVRLVPGLTGIQVVFYDSTTVMYVPLNQERGLLASNIFTLASWKKADNVSATLQDEFIHGAVPNNRVQVHGWLEEGLVEPDYEAELIKRFTNSVSDDQLFQILHEFNVNATLKNYNDGDPKPLQILINLFCKNTKIILSKEFMAFWETYQVYLTHLYPFDFEGQRLGEEERLKTISECEEKFRQINDKFQTRQAEKGTTMTLNTQTVPLILYRTEELLKGITLLVSSKGLFKEIANNKLDQYRYENFLIETARLIDSPFSPLSHLAGNLFRAFARFPTVAERKNESTNKKFLLTSRVKLIQTISETLAKRVLIKHNDSKNHESFYILSILACLKILKTFIYDRKDTTNPEDFQMILEVISSPYYFAMFNFLSRYRSVAIVYDTTIIINSFFQNCTTRDLYKSYQEKFLNNSTLILLHTELVLSSLSVLQRKISVVLLSHLFLENPSACGLVCRIFPKNLFRKVDFMSNDISKWTLAQWEQFFSLASKNFDTATEQWNEDCRGELLSKLKKIDQDINSRFNWCPQNRIHELFDPTFNHSGEFLLNIRWNHEELEMHYEVLQHKILVWKYYLTNLLDDSETPKFSVPVVNPAKLWNELNIKFTGTHEPSEMKLILKVMVLLYKEHHAQVKDLNTMQYWLRCLTNPEFRHCRYLILQLFYTALSVEDIAVIRFNVKKFTDVGGIKVLSDVLSSLYFEEDHINISEEQLEELRNKSPEDMDYNYTKLDIKKQAYTPSLEKSAMILLIINIYKCILYRPIDKTLVLDEKLLYPIPTAKYQIIEQSTVRCLMDVLLLSDDDLALHVLDFFTEYLCDKFTFRSLTDDTPLFEFLLVNMTPKTTQARFNLALKIYNRISDEIFPEVNPIKTYSSFVFTSASPQLVSDAFDMFPLFKYFPKHLIYRLITVGAEDVSKIFWSDSHETPEIIWNSQMKELLIERINEKVQPFKHELVKFSENNKFSSKDNMPIYTGGAPEVVYQNVLDEVKVGPMMLRVWIQRPFYNFELPQDAVTTFIEKLSALLKEYATIQIPQATHKQLEDLLIILKAHAKAIKVYSLTRYTCFKEVIGILSYFSARLSEEDLTQFHQDILAEMSHFILVLCRILYRAIKLDKSENSNIFLENNGLQALLSIIQSMIRKISVNPQPEHHEYYTNLVLSYHDLKIINLAVRMTQRLFVCYPAKFISLDAEKKLEIFLDLQVFTKIPLTLFELIKTQRENPSENLIKRNGTEIFDAAVIEEEQQQYHPGSVSIFEVITTEPHTSSADVYITKIFMFVKNLIDLFSGLSLKIEFSTSFIQSGLNWRLLEFLTYYGEHDPSEDKVHKVNYQSILMNVEKICNVFRNNVIYSNEAYIWKITGGFTSSRGVGIITSKEKSPKLIQSLNKIENNDKMILANFHECVMILLGKHILEMLLSDYFEPVIAPHERELQNIGGFLRVFSTSLHDPATLWNAETRQELKDLLIQQIFDINNSHGKLYLNQIEKFRYTLHQKHLIIYDVFVSLYNKTPEWKIANPPQFLLKTMKNVADLWQTLQDLDNDELLRQDEANLSSTLFNLNEATAAICNVITYHGFEDVLLSEESLTQLGIFLKEHQFANIKDPLLATLKSTCLDIFLNLSKKLSGSLKILENTSILKNTIGLLRSNTKESSVLNQKIIKIVRNVAHEDSLKKALINYGFLVFLLESSLKTEIHPSVYRRDVFDFILKVVKNLPVNHILNKLLLTLFPENIQELIYGTESSDSILETLDQGYDTPKIMWTKMMRHEVLLLLSSESDSIQEKWDSYNAKEIRITDNLVFWSELHNLTPPVFPDLSENICIDNIYLKNFNKDPNFDSHDNIVVFIDDVANFTANIYGDFLKMVAEYENAKKTEDQNAMSIENQKQLDKLSYQMVTLLTALGLSLDKLMFHIKEKERTESMKELYQQRESIKELVSHLPAPAEQKLSVILEPRGSIVQDPILIMSENAVTLIMRSLELFDHLKAHLHILSTELQLIYLISDNERGFTLLRSHDIISIITKLLKVLTGDQNNNPFTFVEEKLILYLLIKVMLKDQLLVADAIEQCVLPLKQLLISNKTYLRPLVENALSILIRDPKKGKDIFNELNHEHEIISVEVIHNCNPKLALQNVWKTFTNPYKSDNVLNLLVEKSPDSNVTYPAISEYSVASVPHPKPENAKAEQVIKQYMVKIVNENSESAECSHLQ